MANKVYVMHNEENNVTIKCTNFFKKHWEDRGFTVKKIVIKNKPVMDLLMEK